MPFRPRHRVQYRANAAGFVWRRRQIGDPEAELLVFSADAPLLGRLAASREMVRELLHRRDRGFI
ncbi:MAG: hypothetical protein WDN49_08395 [Acetobacteraceae bacterium]